jgi:hypothetical protein
VVRGTQCGGIAHITSIVLWDSSRVGVLGVNRRCAGKVHLGRLWRVSKAFGIALLCTTCKELFRFLETIIQIILHCNHARTIQSFRVVVESCPCRRKQILDDLLTGFSCCELY